MGLILRATVVTDPGLVRGNNEDCAHVGRFLAAVADGMGGMPAGELASDIVIKELAVLDHNQLGPDQIPGGADPLAALRGAIKAANAKIRQTTEDDHSQDGMGTTATALLLAGDRLGLAHVGDSRCYAWRDGALSLLTRDDTFVQALVDQGVLSPAEARLHPRRSIVTQAVQGYDVEPYCRELTVQVGDRYLLCSDGLSDVVTDDEIAMTMAGHSEIHECAQHLVALALAGGGPDNVTVIVADIASAD